VVPEWTIASVPPSSHFSRRSGSSTSTTISLGALNTSEPRKELDGIVAKLEATAVAQIELQDYAKGLTAQKNALSESLFVDHIQPIVSLMEMNRSQMLDISALEEPLRH